MKLDVTGNFIWAKHLVGSLGNSTATKSLDIDAAGDLFLTGYFKGTTDFDPNLGVFNLISAGNWGWFHY